MKRLFGVFLISFLLAGCSKLDRLTDGSDDASISASTIAVASQGQERRPKKNQKSLIQITALGPVAELEGTALGLGRLEMTIKSKDDGEDPLVEAELKFRDPQGKPRRVAYTGSATLERDERGSLLKAQVYMVGDNHARALVRITFERRNLVSLVMSSDYVGGQLKGRYVERKDRF